MFCADRLVRINIGHCNKTPSVRLQTFIGFEDTELLFIPDQTGRRRGFESAPLLGVHGDHSNR